MEPVFLSQGFDESRAEGGGVSEEKPEEALEGQGGAGGGRVLEQVPISLLGLS